MKKRIICIVMVTLCCFLSVTGCSSNKSAKETADSTESAQEAKEDGVVTLTMWAEEANFEMYEAMIESFQKKYAGQAEFDIQLVESADSGARDNVLGNIHEAADVFPFADDQLSSLVAGGTLSRVPNASEVRSANQEGSVEAASVDGELFAYPMSADNGFFLYYDKKYFKESDVQTLDQILKVCEKNKKKFSMEWDSGWYTYAFFGNTGMEFGINEDGVTNHCNWDVAEGDITGVDVVNAMLAISASPAFLDLPDGEFPGKIADGTVIAGVSGVWNAMEVQKAWGEDYGAVKLPTYTCNGQQIQMASFTGYKMIGVNAYSEHLDWAHKFADFITNEENQIIRFEQRNQGPSNINAAASDAVEKVPAIQAVIAQSEFGVLQRVGNNFWDPFYTFGEILAKGNPDKISAQELIETLVAGITASTVS